jgi:hypothetical protein
MVETKEQEGDGRAAAAEGGKEDICFNFDIVWCVVPDLNQ